MQSCFILDEIKFCGEIVVLENIAIIVYTFDIQTCLRLLLLLLILDLTLVVLRTFLLQFWAKVQLEQLGTIAGRLRIISTLIDSLSIRRDIGWIRWGLGIMVQKMNLRLSAKEEAIGLAQAELWETFKHYRIFNEVHHIQLSTDSSLSNIQLSFSCH